MILMYHKVDVAALTSMWVTVDAFRRHMLSLQAYDVVALDDYDPRNPRHAAITFDDVYDGVIEYAVPIMHELGYPFELFVNSDWIGRMNDFDRAKEPPARFAGMAGLDRAVALGGRVQWHTRSHLRMRGAAADVLAQELNAPEDLRAHFGPDCLRWFAYPYGDFDELGAEMARARFAGAVATTRGDDGDRHQLTRVLAHEDLSLPGTTVSAVVVSGGCGRVLAETLDSLLRQSCPPDEILVIGDAPDGDAREALASFAGEVRAEHNREPLGMDGCFRQALALAKGDYLLFIGAEHRLRSDCVELCRRALDRAPGVHTARADAAMFGDGATAGGRRIAFSRREGAPIYHVARATPCAMYRRAHFAQGGDHARGVEAGVAHIAAPLFEIRPHGPGAMASATGLEIENARLRAMLASRDAALESLRAQLVPSAQVRRFAGFVLARPRAFLQRAARFPRRLAGAIRRRLRAAVFKTRP